MLQFSFQLPALRCSLQSHITHSFEVNIPQCIFLSVLFSAKHVSAFFGFCPSFNQVSKCWYLWTPCILREWLQNGLMSLLLLRVCFTGIRSSCSTRHCISWDIYPSYEQTSFDERKRLLRIITFHPQVRIPNFTPPLSLQGKHFGKHFQKLTPKMLTRANRNWFSAYFGKECLPKKCLPL